MSHSWVSRSSDKKKADASSGKSRGKSSGKSSGGEVNAILQQFKETKNESVESKVRDAWKEPKTTPVDNEHAGILAAACRDLGYTLSPPQTAAVIAAMQRCCARSVELLLKLFHEVLVAVCNLPIDSCRVPITTGVGLYVAMLAALNVVRETCKEAEKKFRADALARMEELKKRTGRDGTQL